jgi:hypothetical protein
MRPFLIGAVLTLLVTACGHRPAAKPSVSPSSPAQIGAVNPANIKRVVSKLPRGYEVTTGIPSGASPRLIWGLGAADMRVEPPRCAVLADPGNGRSHSAQGVSGSGAGGVVDSVVVALPGPVGLDHNLVAACGRWTMRSGHTTASVRLTDAPHIEDADTLGMLVDLRSSVESGAQIDSRAYTFTAYLGGYYAFTTLTTDPGSAQPSLPPQLAADLLVETVSTLRS